MVIGRGVALPMDKILEGLGAAEEARIKNRIDFVMLFAVHKVGEGSGKVQAMGSCVVIGR